MNRIGLIAIFSVLLLGSSCSNDYTAGKQRADKFELLASQGQSLTPTQQQFIMQEDFSSREEIESTITTLSEINQERAEDTTPKTNPNAGPKYVTPEFRPGRSFLEK